MSKALLKYNYPQVIFGKEIINYLTSSGKKYNTIIDCPCGNGETSWHLSHVNNAKVIAADISESSIHNAKQNFSAPNMDFRVNTLEAILESEKKFDAFCIINSLFLLGDYDQILKQLFAGCRDNKAKAVIIIPNTEGKNFKWFQSRNKNENKLIITEHEIKPFFTEYGFKIEAVRPICYTHHYNRKDVKLFSVFWSFYLRFLDGFQTAFKIGKPNYFLIALSAE